MTYQFAAIDEPVLNRSVKPVTDFTDPDFLQAVELVRQSIRDNQTDSVNAVGMAANQLGFDYAFFFVSIRDDRADREYCHAFPETLFVNPSIEIVDKELVSMAEGCFSLPGLRSSCVERPRSVKVSYQDIDGEHKQLLAFEFFARVFLHEMGHLHGQTFLSCTPGFNKQKMHQWLDVIEQCDDKYDLPALDDIIDCTDYDALDITALKRWANNNK